jgi:DNA polymerase II large subunit
MNMANVLDPTWVLSEETGRLRYEKLKRVRRNPKQRLIVEHINDTVTYELVERYQRIALARAHRGLDND